MVHTSTKHWAVANVSSATVSLFCIVSIVIALICPPRVLGFSDEEVALFLAALGNLAVALSILNCGYSAAVFYFDPEARSAWLLIGLLVPLLVLLMYPAVQTA